MRKKIDNHFFLLVCLLAMFSKTWVNDNYTFQIHIYTWVYIYLYDGLYPAIKRDESRPEYMISRSKNWTIFRVFCTFPLGLSYYYYYY